MPGEQEAGDCNRLVIGDVSSVGIDPEPPLCGVGTAMSSRSRSRSPPSVPMQDFLLLGHVAAEVFGADPKIELDEDLFVCGHSSTARAGNRAPRGFRYAVRNSRGSLTLSAPPIGQQGGAAARGGASR